MKIASITDIHGSVDAIFKLRDVLKKADLILVTGDITHFGHRAIAQQLMETISAINPSLLAVTGNCDHLEIDTYLNEEHISLHAKGRLIDGLGFIGVGASLPTPFNTPNEMPERDFQTFLSQGRAAIPGEIPFILVSHQPPFETTTDRLSSGLHVGSRAVRTFIENEAPLICLTGHIHESRGKDQIGSTIILNPGPASAGNFAWVEIVDGRVVQADIRK